MSADQNKAVVRRFISELLTGGKADLVDELCAPNYVNKAMDADLAGFKAMAAAFEVAIPGRRMEIEDLIAEGDSVVARFTYEWTLASGETISGRGLTYYRLANGKIVEDDPITTPDLTERLAAQLRAQAA
jgi:predicted ester cyclase